MNLTNNNCLDRRTFIKLATLLAVSPTSAAWPKSSGIIVNDLHSQLNQTTVSKIVSIDSLSSLQNVLMDAAKAKKNISICGGRHAGGGQQFGTDTILVDTKTLNRVLNFDRQKGLLEVEAGILWTDLLNYLEQAQLGSSFLWGISQKQTGADRLAIGGTVSANAHGQGLGLKPFISEVESLNIIDADGKMRICSRLENSDLFSLVLGGYGLFGLIYSVTLRLVPRQKVRRQVELIDIDHLIAKVEQCTVAGYPYADFQVNIDDTSEQFLQNGIFCGYQPVDVQTPVVQNQEPLCEQLWFDFAYDVHVDKHDAYTKYLNYYQSTSGLVNWSDVWQSGPYVVNYHQLIDKKLHSAHKATEVLTEIYVPRDKLAIFMNNVRTDFKKNGVNLIFSTIRFIEKDNESFLPWAKERYACVIFNLHTVHTPEGIEHSASAFRRLIDMSIKLGGSYYLTYHKYATRQQVLACYPQFPQFLDLKLKYDPQERFQSDWYRHYKTMFA